MTQADAVTQLCDALDAQASVLEAMVEASQRQVAAILHYRADLRKEEPDELAQSREEMQELLARLGRATEVVKRAGRDVPTAHRPTVVLERMSDVRSLAQALSELQQISQFHAQRGLQVIAAWREQLGGATPAGPTYARNGRPRAKAYTGSHQASVFERDL